MKVPDLIASLREGAGSKLTPEERMEIMQKLLNSESEAEEVVLEEKKLDAHLSATTSGLFKEDADDQNSEFPESLPENGPGRFGRIGRLFRSSKSTDTQLSDGNAVAPGTSVSKLRSLTENKYIVYAVVALVVVFLGWQGANFFLDSDQQNSANRATKAKDNSRKSRAARRGKSKPAVAKATTESDSASAEGSLGASSIQTTLQHCTVPATTRTALTQSSGGASQYESRDYTLAILAIQSYQRKYKASNVTTKIEASVEKYKMAQSLLSPELNILRIQISQYREVQESMQRELTELRERERKSQDGRRLQNRVVAGVNQGIRLRNEIEDLEASLRDGPNSEDLVLVEGQLFILESMLSGANKNLNKPPATRPGAKQLKVTQEIAALTRLELKQLEEQIKQLTKAKFVPITAAVAKASPDLKRYQVQNATKTLAQFIGLLTVLKGTSKKVFSGLERDQIRVNDKLESLLGKSEGAWIDYTPCLKGKT
ncbi:hypothetical protein ACFL17_04190 [Pseudomonadota bacterium]